jgi:lipid II:glycine glycyltransferase (peptidoglycan interpeptide bridge formation enzyme)
MPVVNFEEWNRFTDQFPETHLLQQSAWGKLKEDFGWKPEYVVTPTGSGAMILFKPLPLGLCLAYIPKGPLGSDWVSLLAEIDELCRERKAVFLKVEPDTQVDQEEIVSQLVMAGFRKSSHNLQPARTIVINLLEDEDTILARMKQKTRYNIRLAGRKQVEVTTSSDVDTFCAMMEVTGKRDAFGVHTGDYYRRAYQLFHPSGRCEMFIASYQGAPLAGLMAFSVGKRAWYLYGASNNKERNRMPTYLIQWAAIQWAKERGCAEYDLWGVPDYDEEILEAQFSVRSDGLWGVYRFKRGFGGQIKRSIGSYDKVYRPLLYLGYKTFAARRSGE